MSRQLFVTRLIAFLFFLAGAVEVLQAISRDSLWFYGLSSGLLVCTWLWNERARAEKARNT